MKHKHAEVLIALAEGKEVEWQSLADGSWSDVHPQARINPIIDKHLNWRVKPAPEPEWKQRLRQAAREGKVVQKKCGNAWLFLNRNYETWDLLGKESDYRIVEPTVVKWLWACGCQGDWFLCNKFMTEDEAKNQLEPEEEPFIKLEYTRTEFPS